MPGNFVISLDFELMWGLRERADTGRSRDAVLGARAAIPAILDRFQRHGVRATWATVGLLFARTRSEMLDFAPRRRPVYGDRRRDPFDDFYAEVGRNERTDPLHFGRSLIDLIAATPGQEIASHGYAHLTCLDEGPSLADFEADLAASIAISLASGHSPRSLVFPRNQMTDMHVAACARQGICAVRGPAPSVLYRPRPRAEETATLRAMRLLDGVLPLVDTLPGLQSGAATGPQPGRCVSVPASRFLRPVSALRPGYSRLHVARILAEMRRAAATGQTYHLWWHPHNLGLNTAANLAQLDAILAGFVRLRDRAGLTSRAMADLAPALASSTTAPLYKVLGT